VDEAGCRDLKYAFFVHFMQALALICVAARADVPTCRRGNSCAGSDYGANMRRTCSAEAGKE
jgi:hypothetical protein